MVVRRGCYKKEDLEEALDRAYEREKLSAVARTSSTRSLRSRRSYKPREILWRDAAGHSIPSTRAGS
ncbi:hypothetical protein JG688_00008950 [Phytophthora aleatoria]|uniref:Uncharacterized protein n=1 Tax=Phytophthora aleatoria TaxID=2496075 RepID=A0A8J5IH17_9STRA|nr:hypothetical protein JG688_00008950 [Phytophthora aleatoria]